MNSASAYMEASLIVDTLAELSFPNAFNPYSEVCQSWDRRDGPAIRRANLRAVLGAGLSSTIDSIWIARDLGYRGGRRTGLPMTDEYHLADQARLFGTRRLSRATHGPVVKERTASMVWDCLWSLERRVFLWNIFPLHPHLPGDEMSNRRHSGAEGIACQPLLARVLEGLQPRSIVAIGRDAQSVLTRLHIPAAQVRHPSYGGQKEFASGLAAHYGSPVN